MNKKGQTLILFVFLLPIFLLFMALIVDIGIMKYEKIKGEDLGALAVKEIIKQDFNIEAGKKILVKNDIDIDNLELKIEDSKVSLKNTYQIDSIFGSIVGIKKYKIKIDITGIKQNDKINFIKKDD